MTLPTLSAAKQSLLLLTLTIAATLLVEHSSLDIAISQLFFHHGHWLIEKAEQPYAFIFYDLPKALIILLGIGLMIALLSQYSLKNKGHHKRISINHSKNYETNNALDNSAEFITPKRRWLYYFGSEELLFLLISLIVVPSMIASLKSVTHVSCPNHLTIFQGEYAYLTIWENILARTPAKCFPAAHASAGFSLYAIAYLPRLRQYRVRLITTVTCIGWSMGLYKMSIGDHFFSHTLVSMGLSWAIVCALAAVMFERNITSKSPIDTAAITSTTMTSSSITINSSWASDNE